MLEALGLLVDLVPGDPEHVGEEALDQPVAPNECGRRWRRDDVSARPPDDDAPGQRDDPGVTVIMAGIGVAILGVALIVLVLRMLLAQAVARDVEATQMQAELDEVI